MSDTPSKQRNPALWLIFAIPVLGVTLALVTLGAAIATNDTARFEATTAPLSKTSWQQPQGTP